jgi:hypothetical protein
MKTYKASSCDDLKLELIQKIIEADCSVLNGISITEKCSNLRAMFSREITEEEKNSEMKALQKDFATLQSPSSFKVKGFEEVLKTHIFDSDFMHLYFVKDESGINLLFRFNTSDECPAASGFTNDDKMYLLSGADLKPISAVDAKVMMDAFVATYNKYYRADKAKKITEYITHDLSTVRRNFYRFEEDTDLIIGAKQDGNALRMNIILSIPTADCKTATTTGTTAFYNVGVTRP